MFVQGFLLVLYQNSQELLLGFHQGFFFQDFYKDIIPGLCHGISRDVFRDRSINSLSDFSKVPLKIHATSLKIAPAVPPGTYFQVFH